MKSRIAIAIVFSACLFCRADWRLDFDDAFAQLFGVTGTPIPEVAWFKFDGNALDSSGNNYDGTWSGTPTYETGKFAGTSSAIFDASNYVIKGTNLNVTQALTIMAWVRSSGYTDTNPRIVGTENRWIIFLNTVPPLGTLCFYGSGINTRFPSSETSIFDGQWHHVSAVYDGEGIDGYVDGQSVGTIAKVGDLLPQETVPITIGNRTDGARGLNGNIQDARIYKRALSQQNIQRIMTGQNVQPIEEQQ